MRGMFFEHPRQSQLERLVRHFRNTGTRPMGGAFRCMRLFCKKGGIKYHPSGQNTVQEAFHLNFPVFAQKTLDGPATLCYSVITSRGFYFFALKRRDPRSWQNESIGLAPRFPDLAGCTEGGRVGTALL